MRTSGIADFEPWLDRLVYFPEEIVDRAQKQIPPEWMAEDAAALEALLEKLMSRRRRIPDLIRDSTPRPRQPISRLEVAAVSKKNRR